MAKKIIIAGGGTGGHIFPAIAIANALKRHEKGLEILFVGAKGRMEMERVPQAGYNIKGLTIAGFNRSSMLKNVSLVWKLAQSFWEVRSIFKTFMPDAVIGVGGYSSFPVLRYAQTKGIPTFLHESNSFAGKSNMLLGKRAAKIFVASDGMEKFFPKEKIIITGNPVRPEIDDANTIAREAAAQKFGLSVHQPIVLAVGGSLGARSINEALEKGLDTLLAGGIQLIWQTGKVQAERWKERAQGKQGVWISPFITSMQDAYAAADVVVSRAGAMAVAELCVVQKPSLFVPLPHAAEDHQTANAKALVDKGAALMVKDSDAKESIIPMIIALAHDMGRRNQLKIEIGKYAVRNADEHVAMEILKSLNNR